MSTIEPRLPLTCGTLPADVEKPLLFLDIDGVISLLGFADPRKAPGTFHDIDGVAHCICPGTGERLETLADSFELVWASGWESLANEHLPALLGLHAPGLPTLTFEGRAEFGSSHWKLEAIGAYAGDRPLAWIDDNIDDSCRLWGLSREAPTLLVEAQPDVGLTDAHVTSLCRWAERHSVVPS